MHDLGLSYPPEYSMRYPGMSRVDRAIWDVWRPKHTTGALRVYYSVKIGNERGDMYNYTAEEQKLWWRLCCRKIDVVVEWDFYVDIIEVRNHARADAIGRLLTYQEIWKQDPPIWKKAGLFLLTNHEEPDIRSIAQLHGITYAVVTHEVKSTVQAVRPEY